MALQTGQAVATPLRHNTFGSVDCRSAGTVRRMRYAVGAGWRFELHKVTFLIAAKKDIEFDGFGDLSRLARGCQFVLNPIGSHRTLHEFNTGRIRRTADFGTFCDECLQPNVDTVMWSWNVTLTFGQPLSIEPGVEIELTIRDQTTGLDAFRATVFGQRFGA